MSTDGAEHQHVTRNPVPLPCTVDTKCSYQPNEVFVGGSRKYTCPHGETFIIAAERPRAIVYTVRNVTPKKEKK